MVPVSSAPNVSPEWDDDPDASLLIITYPSMVAVQVVVMELVFTAIAVASTWNVSIEL